MQPAGEDTERSRCETEDEAETRVQQSKENKSAEAERSSSEPPSPLARLQYGLGKSFHYAKRTTAWASAWYLVSCMALRSQPCGAVKDVCKLVGQGCSDPKCKRARPVPLTLLSSSATI